MAKSSGIGENNGGAGVAISQLMTKWRNNESGNGVKANVGGVSAAAA
jgi:hypothetical protein